MVASTQFIGGEECRLFEQEFAAYCGAKHAVGVANGTDALTVALRAYGIGPGDEVVTVANTFIATGEAILLNGARPVFVDVEAASFTMDPFNPGNPALTTEVPLFVLLLLAMALGMLVGGTAAWLRQGRYRKLARQRGQEAERLRRQTVRADADPRYPAGA